MLVLTVVVACQLRKTTMGVTMFHKKGETAEERAANVSNIFMINRLGGLSALKVQFPVGSTNIYKGNKGNLQKVQVQIRGSERLD